MKMPHSTKKQRNDRSGGSDSDSEADRKRRKHRKKRKEKHKSSSGKSSEDKKTEKKQRRRQRVLCKLIDWGLVTFPHIFDELLTLFKSLHDGEYVSTDAISNINKRIFLEQLMELLPVRRHSALGYYKEAVDTNINELLAAYLSRRHGVQSSLNKNSSGAVSMIAIRQSYLPRLLQLLENSPQLKLELAPLLQYILGADGNDSDGSASSASHDGTVDGGGVNVEELENEEVRDDLERLFIALGLEKINHSYSIAPRDTAAAAAVRRVLRMLRRAAEHQKRIDKDKASSTTFTNTAVEVLPVVASVEAKSKLMGPAKPTQELLEAAAVVNDYEIWQESDNSDDTEVGPQLYDPSFDSRIRIVQQQPLGLTGVEIAAVAAAAPEGSNETAAMASEREEWLLTPGENKLIAELNGGMPTNRKFQTGKQAKKRADELAIKREHMRQQQEEQEAKGLQTNGAEMQEAASIDKGPSLMEEHMQQHAGKFRGAHIPAKKRRREEFDYERDIVSHRRLDSNAVHNLVEDAKQLDSRFSKGSVQRSF